MARHSVGVNPWIIAIIIAVVVAAGGYGYFAYSKGLIKLQISPAQGQCADVFCNDYQWICCNEFKSADSPKTVTLSSSQDYETCPSYAKYCIINSANFGSNYNGYWVGTTCEIKHGFLGIGTWYACSDDQFYTVSNVKVYPNQKIHPNTYMQFTMSVYTDRLVWCGTSGCDAANTGIPVQGADGCKFTTGNDIYNIDGSLNQQVTASVSKTVPSGSCYLAQGSRHICGNTCESCTSNTDCQAGHTLLVNNLGAECISGQVQEYGCRNYGTTPSATRLAADGSVNLLPKETASYNYGTRCEVIASQAVGCCPDSCGASAVCDVTALPFTCKSTAQCSADWQCGTTQSCDSQTKTLTKPVCSAGKCTTTAVKGVECCGSQDCKAGYFCSATNTCLQNLPDCPDNQCCLAGNGQYTVKPTCAGGKTCCLPTSASLVGTCQDSCSGQIDCSKPENAALADCQRCVIGSNVFQYTPAQCCGAKGGEYVTELESNQPLLCQILGVGCKTKSYCKMPTNWLLIIGAVTAGIVVLILIAGLTGRNRNAGAPARKR